ncbi:hypothetical protein NST55_28880 [Bacillus sp. FSL R10-2789]|uniref:hypothetical protein n=1 Tax=Bacillus sp. FSL R10-2789 TaxID=2954662 RepID=UPI0030F7447A
MAFTTQQNFVGVLSDTDIVTLNSKIDYKKTKLEDRKKIVEGIIEGTEFYNEYFSSYFKATINAGDSLSHNVNVCKSLERMANYLLNSEEIKKEEDENVVQYVFHTDPKYFQKKVDREKSIEGLTETENGGHAEEIIHFLKREGKNYKKGKDQFINAKDLERADFLGEVLRSYNSLLEFVTEELKKKGSSQYNRYLLTKIKGQLSNDMIYSKDHLLGIWGYELKGFSESTVYDLDVFDFTNKVHLNGIAIEVKGKDGKPKKEHIKGLLYFKPDFDPSNDFSYILKDLQDTVDKAGLTEEEKFVLEQMRNGASKVEVARALNTHHVKIMRTMEIITNKVCKVGNKYDGKRGEA